MPSLSARDVSHIGKFDGAHFSFWKLNIRTVLERHRLYGIANGEILCPVADTGLPLENFQLPCQAIQNMATLPCFAFFFKKFKKAMKMPCIF